MDDRCPSQPSTYFLIGLLRDGMIILMGNPGISDVTINIAAPECVLIIGHNEHTVPLIHNLIPLLFW
jgi:hypothetical protein